MRPANQCFVRNSDSSWKQLFVSGFWWDGRILQMSSIIVRISGEEDGGMWPTGCGGHGGDTWPLWPHSWWDWYETLTTYWFVLWRPEERDDQWPGPSVQAASPPPQLAAPPRLILSVICQYWSERGGGIIRNYHQQPHFRAVTSTSA